MVSRECAEELIELMERAWALFEPRIASVLEEAGDKPDPDA